MTEVKHMGVIIRVWPRHHSKFQSYDVCSRGSQRLLAVGTFNTEFETMGEVIEAIKLRHKTYGAGEKIEATNKRFYARAS